MTAKNDITGDSIQSRVASQKYIDNYDRIFRRNKDEIINNTTNVNTTNNDRRGEDSNPASN